MRAAEIMSCIGIAGNQYKVQRGVQGFSAAVASHGVRGPSLLLSHAEPRLA